jgi:hypothetical protein
VKSPVGVDREGSTKSLRRSGEVARSRHGTHPGIELGARDISTGRWSPSGLRSRSGSARRTSPEVLVARAGAAAGAEEAGTIAAGRSPVTRSGSSRVYLGGYLDAAGELLEGQASFAGGVAQPLDGGLALSVRGAHVRRL